MSGRGEIQGVLTAMVTPFAADGEVDLAAARRLAVWQVDEGCHGLVLAGTTGESATLGDDEKLALLEAVLAEVGDRAVIVLGTGSNDTRHSAELTEKAVTAGADAVLAVTPYYNKPNEAGLRAHFAAISDAAAETPVILYNIPSRSVINMPPELLATLAADHANVIALKQANDDELGPIEGLAILAGNDDVFCRTLGFGGAGGILVASNVAPGRLRAVYDAALAGDGERAAALDEALKPLYAAMSVAPPVVSAKTALELLGRGAANVRLPMVPASGEERGRIAEALALVGVTESAEAAA